MGLSYIRYLRNNKSVHQIIQNIIVICHFSLIFILQFLQVFINHFLFFSFHGNSNLSYVLSFRPDKFLAMIF